MSKTVYVTHKVECERCEENQLLDLTRVDNDRWGNDPKVRHHGDEKWEKSVHCDCGYCLRPRASRYGHRGFSIVDREVERVSADEIEDEDADFSTLF